jgi:nicotinate dehydrogenase subunit B
MTLNNSHSRRQFLKESTGLVIGFSLTDFGLVPRLLAMPVAGVVPAPSPAKLESWLRIAEDGTVHVFTDKPDIGMGVLTAFGQIVAEELDVAFERVSFVIGDTAVTASQGGVGGSTSIMQGAKPLRNAAATARYVLLQMAGRQLGVSTEELEVKNGTISIKGNESRHITYAELAGAKELNETLKVSGSGFSINVEGAGKPKNPANYTVVGKPIPRVDLPPKILGHFVYAGDVRVPGMLHGRVVRPSAVGANVASVDEDSAKAIPGHVKTVVKGNFVGVVAESEWSAIQAAKALKVTWSSADEAFPPMDALYNEMRSSTPRLSKVAASQGDADAALARAGKKITAKYEFPFQSHATMGPGCAVADVHRDGVTTVWSGAQKPHELQKGISQLLDVPLDQVRIIWTEDSGSYGRPGYEDASADAALLSDAVGKPVRVQWMRSDMTAWGPKGPAVVCDLAGGLDSRGNVSGLKFESRAYSGTEITPRPDNAGSLLAGQLIGIPNTAAGDEFAMWGEQSVSYEIPDLHAVGHILEPLYSMSSPLRTTHLRDPEGPAVTFATESFIDELATAASVDPIEFRLRYLSQPRAIAVLRAAAAEAGWDSRPSPKRPVSSDEILTGRGIALGTRGGVDGRGTTYVATIAEVEVSRRSGVVRVTRFVCAHDCGLVVNPDGLRGVIAANLIQSLSRTLKEEVFFDRSNVTSVDWKTYPVARASDIPARIDTVILNHTEIPPCGAGEPSSRPTAAAIGNAVFDATGARIRRTPFTSARIKSALEKV